MHKIKKIQSKIKVLYVSDFSSSNYHFDHLLFAFKKNPFVKLNTLFSKTSSMSFIDKIAFKLKFERDKVNINAILLQELAKHKYDVIFICKGTNILPKTLKQIFKLPLRPCLVSYSGDNMSKWHNKSLYYHFGLKYYDLIFSVNIPSYKKIEESYFGNGDIVYLDKSFSQYLHRPLSLKRKFFKFDVLFVGTFEKERMQFINFIASCGIRVDVFGSYWEESKRYKLNPNLILHYRELTGKEYVSAIFYAKITLGFLRKINEDTQTSRSIEIPACGGFMLMERTAEHLRLFKEGLQAEFFSTKEELLQKVNYYLEHSGLRENIARNGRRRCYLSKYSYDDNVNRILVKILQKVPL